MDNSSCVEVLGGRDDEGGGGDGDSTGNDEADGWYRDLAGEGVRLWAEPADDASAQWAEGLLCVLQCSGDDVQ